MYIQKLQTVVESMRCKFEMRVNEAVAWKCFQGCGIAYQRHIISIAGCTEGLAFAQHMYALNAECTLIKNTMCSNTVTRCVWERRGRICFL